MLSGAASLCHAQIYKSPATADLFDEQKNLIGGMSIIQARACEDTGGMLSFPRNTIELLKPEQIYQGLAKTMELINKDVAQDPLSQKSGCTFCLTIGIRVGNKVYAYIAGLGDSYAKLYIFDDKNKLYFQTLINAHIHQPDKDHVETKAEADRVIRETGIAPKKFKQNSLDYYIGKLAVSRSLGDFDQQVYGLSNQPEINSLKEKEEQSQRKFPDIPPGGRAVIVINSDILDYLHTNLIDQIIGQKLKEKASPKEIARTLNFYARSRYEGHVTPIDDGTFVVLFLDSPQMVGGFVCDGHRQANTKTDKTVCCNSVANRVAMNLGSRISEGFYSFCEDKYSNKTVLMLKPPPETKSISPSATSKTVTLKTIKNGESPTPDFLFRSISDSEFKLDSEAENSVEMAAGLRQIIFYSKNESEIISAILKLETILPDLKMMAELNIEEAKFELREYYLKIAFNKKAAQKLIPKDLQDILYKSRNKTNKQLYLQLKHLNFFKPLAKTKALYRLASTEEREPFKEKVIELSLK